MELVYHTCLLNKRANNPIGSNPILTAIIGVVEMSIRTKVWRIFQTDKVQDFIYDFIYACVGGLNASFESGYWAAEKYHSLYIRLKEKYDSSNNA